MVFKHASEETLMFLLLKYLPVEYQEIVISHVQNGQWNYGMAVAHIENEVARMVPTLKRIQRWHESKPTGGSCAALQAWYPAWRTRMHGLCINEKVAGEQFVETMQGMFTNAVADLLAALDENPAWTLDEKYEFVLRRARIPEQMKKMASEKQVYHLARLRQYRM